MKLITEKEKLVEEDTLNQDRLTQLVRRLLENARHPWEPRVEVNPAENRLTLTLTLNTGGRIGPPLPTPPDREVEELAEKLGWFLEKKGATLYKSLYWCRVCHKLLNLRNDKGEMELNGHDSSGLPIYSHKRCGERLRMLRGAHILQLRVKVKLSEKDPETVLESLLKNFLEYERTVSRSPF